MSDTTGTAARSASSRPAPGDVVAGVSVALVLIPQSLAYAVLAGVSPHHGLYAAILPPIAAAFFASSAFLQTGPVAMTSLLTLGALTPLAAPFTAEYAALAALLALIVGAVRLTVGVTGTGIIAYLLSQPVIVGFTLAAEVLIVFSQLPAALGMTAPGTGILADAWWAVGAVADWNLAAIGLSFLTGVLVIGGRRVHAVFPGVLVAVVLGTALAAVFGYHGPTLGELPSVLPRLSVAMPWSRLPDLFVPGLVIALVGFVDAAAVGRLMAAKTRQRWDPDREFVSQGIANLASGVANGFPVGGSFGRSLLAASAGARTRWTGAIAGLTVLAFLPAAGVLARLPNAILAAAIIATVAKVVDVRSLTGIHRHSRPQAAIAWTTFALTLLLAPRIEQAILVGIGLGVAVHLWRERKVEIRRRMDGKTLHLEPMGVLFFGSAPQLDDAFIAELAANPDAERLVLDLRHLGRIDYAGALLVQRVAQAAEQAGLDVRITGLPPRGGGVLRRVLGEQNRWLQPAPEG